MTTPDSQAISPGSWAYGTVLGLVIRDRGGCQHVLKGSSSTFQQKTAAAGRGGGGEAITPSRPKGIAGAATASSSPRIRSRSICDV